jgi:formylglycine-generating enzyme required for sulfatase activity
MKAKFRSLFIVLALIAGVHPALAQPLLSIAPAGNRSVISWPVSATNYVLQSTTNLASHNWVTVSNAMPVTTSNKVTVTVSNTSFAKFFRLINTNTSVVPAGMALIPTGSFTMGDTLDGNVFGDATPTNVTVSAFVKDVNLVSYSQWQSVYSYATNHGFGFVHAGGSKATNHPVQTVDWFDCVKWCNARSQQAGLTSVYYTDAGLTHIYTNGEVTVYVNWAAQGYRLPTEAEWEKAARGGLSGQRFPWGNTISESQANYFGNTAFSYDLGPDGHNATYATGAIPYTSPIGSFATNGYGLYDMAGNVFAWCGDWYGTTYAGGSDPQGPPSGTDRVLRGGSWDSYASYARCALRVHGDPFFADNYIGFHCVRRL